MAHSKAEAVCHVLRHASAMPDLRYCLCGFLAICDSQIRPGNPMVVCWPRCNALPEGKLGSDVGLCLLLLSSRAACEHAGCHAFLLAVFVKPCGRRRERNRCFYPLLGVSPVPGTRFTSFGSYQAGGCSSSIASFNSSRKGNFRSVIAMSKIFITFIQKEL